MYITVYIVCSLPNFVIQKMCIFAIDLITWLKCGYRPIH